MADSDLWLAAQSSLGVSSPKSPRACSKETQPGDCAGRDGAGPHAIPSQQRSGKQHLPTSHMYFYDATFTFALKSFLQGGAKEELGSGAKLFPDLIHHFHACLQVAVTLGKSPQASRNPFLYYRPGRPKCKLEFLKGLTSQQLLKGAPVSLRSKT